MNNEVLNGLFGLVMVHGLCLRLQLHRAAGGPDFGDGMQKCDFWLHRLDDLVDLRNDDLDLVQ